MAKNDSPLQSNNFDCGVLVLTYCASHFYRFELPTKILPRFWRKLFTCMISPDEAINFDNLSGKDKAHANKNAISMVVQNVELHRIYSENLLAANNLRKSLSALLDEAGKTLDLCKTAKEGDQLSAMRKLLSDENYDWESHLLQKVNKRQKIAEQMKVTVSKTISAMEPSLKFAEQHQSGKKDSISSVSQKLKEQLDEEQEKVEEEQREVEKKRRRVEEQQQILRGIASYLKN